MANVQSRVDDVNKAVKQLEDSRHPRTKEVKDCQARLNKRYRVLADLPRDTVSTLLSFEIPLTSHQESSV